MNYVSPLLNRNSTANNSMIPHSVGKQVPNNPKDLMSQLRTLELRASAAKLPRAVSNIASRILQQEQKSEMIERVLMQNEDPLKYNKQLMCTPADERIHMEVEDLRSLQADEHFRNAEKLDFREKIRREVEARRLQEELEKAAKRKAAEERRAAVVARIRKQQEEEERKAREIVEAAERAVREAELRLERERQGMIEEDEISQLSAQLAAEEEQRIKWRAEQEEKLRVWEEEQRKKDEIDASARAVRLAELEAKKQKLAELQRKQTNGSQAVAAAAGQISVESARQEALKLSKQMKMQNKAKFVSKKRQTASADTESLATAAKSTVSPATTQQPIVQKDTLPAISLDMQTKIDAINSEKEMHAMQRDLMAKKRDLRIQLHASADKEGKTAADIQAKVDEVSSVELYLQQRIESVQQKPNMSTERKHSIQQQISVAATDTTTANNKSSSDVRESSGVATDNALYVEVEKCIRDVNTAIDKSAVNYKNVTMNEQHDIQRSLGLLQLQLADLISRFANTDDIVGYREKLQVAQLKLDTFVEKRGCTSQPSCSTSPTAKLRITVADDEHQTLRRSSSARLTTIPPPPDDSAAASQGMTPQKSLHSLPTPEAATPSAPPIDTSLALHSPPSSFSSAYNSGINSSLNYSESSKSSAEGVVFPALSNRSPMAAKDQSNQVLPVVSERDDLVLERNSAIAELGDGVIFVPDNEVVEDEVAADDESNYVNYEDIDGWNECLYTTMATAAHHAAFYGYTGVLEILSRYFDVFVMDKNGRTPLFYACLRNNLDCVLLLIAIDAQWVDVGDYRGDTSLHATAIADGVSVLEFLLSCEVQPDVANNEGLTCSHLAKSCRALSLLHDAGAMLYCVDSHSRMPLWYACKDGRPDCVEYLCSKMPKEYIMWSDDEGNSPLHLASSNGNSECVDVICRCVAKLEDLSSLNKKHYTAAHVAINATVLQKLFEHGVNLWSPDAKGRYPLFICAFHGYVDCVALLMELGMYQDVSLILAKDVQGDTVLHVACLCGHMPVASLLLYFLRDEPNKQGLTPSFLAERAGHHHIASLVKNVESSKCKGFSGEDIFQCMLEDLSAVILYHGSRWDKLYDAASKSVYYFDRVLGTSQWERPISYDGDAKDEIATDAARDALIRFFSIYSPQRLAKINEIINMYRNRYTELFIELATRYKIPDISIFTNAAAK